MTAPEHPIRIRVDVANPGQFFACCGLLELAHLLWPGVEGWFGDGEFLIAVSGTASGRVEDILVQLCNSRIEPDESRGEAALHPVRLALPGKAPPGSLGLTLDWWIDSNGTKTRLKLWAGQQTSLHIVSELQAALARLDTQRPAGEMLDNPMPLTGRFGVDPRAAWNALDMGFSPNDQKMKVATYPAVELLAAVGLQRCRPVVAREGLSGATVGLSDRAPLPGTRQSQDTAGHASRGTGEFVTRGGLSGATVGLSDRAPLSGTEQSQDTAGQASRGTGGGNLRYATWAVPLPAVLAPAAAAGMLPVESRGLYQFQIGSRGSYKGFDFATRIAGDPA